MDKPDIPKALSMISFGLIVISTIILLLFILFALPFQILYMNPDTMVIIGILTSLCGIIGLFAFMAHISIGKGTRTQGLELSCLGVFIGVFREGGPANINYIKKFEQQVGKKPAMIMWYQDWEQNFPAEN